MQQSLVFSFFEYLKNLLANHSWGLSDSSYPQTVQYFIFAAFPHTLHKFSLIFLASMGTFGLFMFFRAEKREMGRDFSRLSAYLRMDFKRIKRQALFAALPGQALFWSFFSPFIFFALLFFEAKFGIQGLGMLLETAFSMNDLPLMHGSLFCIILFTLTINSFFLFFKAILPRK